MSFLDMAKESIQKRAEIPLKVSDFLREGFEERAAIMEYDGGLSREEAEKRAWAIVQARNN